MLYALLLLSLPACADRGVPLSNSTHAMLPNGLLLEVKDGALWVVRQGVPAPVPPPEDWPGYRAPVKALAQITATDDKRLVTIRFSDACGVESELRVTLNSLWARTESALGKSAYERKEYAAAAPLFARALQTDESLNEAALGQGRALVRQGKTAEALEAVESLLAKEPAKTYLQCLTDPDLAPLLNGQRLVNLRSATPGSARLSLNDVLKGRQEFAPGKLVAFEPVRRLLAAVVRFMDPPPLEEENGKFHWHAAFIVIDAKTGAVLLRLPLVSAGETAGGDSLLHPRPVLAASAKTVATRVEMANRGLADLGLALPDQIKGVLETAHDTPSGTMPFAFPGTTLRLTAASSGTVELKDVASVREPAQLSGPESIAWAVWLPGPGMAVFQWGQYPGQGCPKIPFDGLSVLRP